ncbi:MAG: hypothetical protein Q9160_002620 [Pyrenula sp. 1 TL-2023]
MAEEERKNTDGSSIKPVSSLLSHFEGLAQPRATSSAQQSPRDSPRYLKLAERLESSHGTASGRASLDLPRPISPWSLSTNARHEDEGLVSRTPDSPRSGTTSPGKIGHRRPMSMLVHSSPQLTPTVTLESPRSPPRGYLQTRSGSKSPDRKPNTSFLGHSQFSLTPSSSRPPSRPSTPRVDASKRDPPRSRSIATPSPGPTDRPSPRNRSVPPPVNRADKPKIPSRPLQPPSTIEPYPPTLKPSSKPSENRVSPFSTPPSSEGSASPGDAVDVTKNDHATGVRASALQTKTRNPYWLKGFKDSSQAPDTLSRSTDPRNLGFTRSGPASDSDDARRPGISGRSSPPKKSPHMRAIPTSISSGFNAQAGSVPRQITHDVANSVTQSRPSLEYQRAATSDVNQRPTNLPQRDARKSGFKGGGSITDADEEDKPGLPPRRTGIEPPPRPPNHTKGLAFTAKIPSTGLSQVDRSARPQKPTSGLQSSNTVGTQSFPPPPKRNTDPQPPHNVSETQDFQTTARDSDDEDELADEPSTQRSEYPDTSQANRRPPYFSSGAQEIPTKYDSRVFDVCGQFVCATGYTTRVWDLLAGEQLMSLNHGETVKSLSVAFKPGRNFEEEGTKIWIGNSLGELHEIDVLTQSIIASSLAHGRREITRILRHRKDLWTLDDEGKLFVWSADEGGTPSLRYSHQSYRVKKGHSFSMAVSNKLWLAAGKEIHIYRPGTESSFHVLQRPLLEPQSGDITSGTFEKQSGRVYFGHADGKVSIYSAKDLVLISSVKASDYKINAMTYVGDSLWAAYKTGKIYVYDTSVIPWKVRKDWKAHEGPAASLLVDPSSIWTLNRLQVVSLGHDNYVRFWDGMLEEDWIENWMQVNDVEYCRFREIYASVITWNAGACNPFEIRSDFIADAIHPENPPEILVFGFQELVDLEDRAVTAKNFLGFGHKKKDASKAEHISRVYREWRDYLSRSINRYMGSRASYGELHTSSLIGLFTCVFIKQEERGRIGNLSGSEVKCGMKGHYGNKGALITRFMLDDSSICFVNCHLAAGQTQTSHRNNDIASILEAESLPVERDAEARASKFVSGGDGTQILDHEICILNGDLNYRIDSMPRDTVINFIQRNELGKLLERDQMTLSRRRISGFRLSPFVEAPITFAPTYKYDVGTDRYDTSEKKRLPAWCDRLLYRGAGRVKQLEYRRHEVRMSDHRPVSGTFKMRIKTIDPWKRSIALEKCLHLFGEQKRRLAERASIDYLVNSLGLAEAEARRLIVEQGTGK